MKLNEMYAKLEALKTEAESFTKETPIKDIQAKTKEIKELKARIELAEESEEDAKGLAAKKISDGSMTSESPYDDKEDIRGSKTYANGFYNMIRGAALTPEQKAVVNVISTTGVPVPKSFQNKLIIALEEENIMRQLATVLTTESDKDIPVVATKGSADWTDESGAFNESDDTFGTVTLSAYKLTRILKVSEEILEDVTFDLEGYLVQSFARALAVPEEAAMVSGDGTKKPTGVIIGAGTGVTALSETAITTDEIIDLYYSLKRVYRDKSTWIMHDSTIKAVRKLKDSNNDYIWAKGLAGEPDTILGRPVRASNAMPTLAESAKVIAFGDISYYQIADRSKRTFQRLNELYSANGQVGFRGYERVDGKLTLAEAVKVLVMKASA
jgi:HK97 family phage major capsid protein